MALGIAKIDGLDRPSPASFGEALQYETIQGLLACGSFNDYEDVRRRARRVLDAVSGNPEVDGEGVTVTTTREVCPRCGRIRGVSWRERTKEFICRLCGNVWKPTPIQSTETIS